MEFTIKAICVFSIIVILCLPSNQQEFYRKRQNFTQIAIKLGLKVNEYNVRTQDGYILKLFNILGDKRKPVLLMHGVIDSADTFILRENTSLSVALAKSGYDVWVGNTRGNRYGRQHVFLDPDVDNEFWDFSFHECGFYDLPAIINFILEKTEQKSLSAIGHSLGNTIFYVLAATRPDYNEKIKVLIALSPICFLNNIRNIIFLVMKSVPPLSHVYTTLGQEEFFGDDTVLGEVYKGICKKNYQLCAHGLFFPIAGSDPAEMEPEIFPTIVEHYPTGTSLKNINHLTQVGESRSFAEFDYQWLNMDIYNSTKPPEYDLSKVTMKIALLAGNNDEISTLKDVDLLRRRLPNVVEYRVMPRKKFNHIDAVWGRHMYKYLFPSIFEILLKYTSKVNVIS